MAARFLYHSQAQHLPLVDSVRWRRSVSVVAQWIWKSFLNEWETQIYYWHGFWRHFSGVYQPVEVIRGSVLICWKTLPSGGYSDVIKTTFSCSWVRLLNTVGFLCAPRLLQECSDLWGACDGRSQGPFRPDATTALLRFETLWKPLFPKCVLNGFSQRGSKRGLSELWAPNMFRHHTLERLGSILFPSSYLFNHKCNCGNKTSHPRFTSRRARSLRPRPSHGLKPKDHHLPM